MAKKTGATLAGQKAPEIFFTLFLKNDNDFVGRHSSASFWK